MWRVLLVILLGSCTTSKDVAVEFYDKAKQYESDLYVFLNVSFTTRGTKDNKPFIPRLEIALSETESIMLPGIDSKMSDDEIKASPFFDNMAKYAEATHLPDSIAYEAVKRYCIDIVDLAQKLEVYKIQSTPRLGKFIIFTLSDNDEIIYAPDLSSVRTNYWKEFFKSGETLGKNWYLRNASSINVK